MKRVLIISPHFPPVNTADMQRVRMLLPFFKENGWQAEVLAVSPEEVASSKDEWLLEGLPKDVPIHQVHAISLGWSGMPGLGSLGMRAMRAMAQAGDRLLENSHFDLVYFSTTVFEIHKLGPHWKKKYSVPFVMDYQDPWVNDYYREHPEITPPGGRLKYAATDLLHRWMEPRVLRHCSGITTVSEAYARQLVDRYSEISMPPVLVQAFPGAGRDFERLTLTDASMFDKTGGKSHWLYIGRGGADMAMALRGFFSAIQEYADEELKKRLTIHFIGTSYARAGSGKKTIAPIAAEYGLEHIVVENSDRIAYSSALQYLKQADALIVPGSDDPAYTASKIYPYLLSQRPLLTIFHQDSGIVDLIENVGGAVSATFSSQEGVESLAERIAGQWLRGKQYLQSIPLNNAEFLQYLDQACARKMSEFFEHCLENEKAVKARLK